MHSQHHPPRLVVRHLEALQPHAEAECPGQRPQCVAGEDELSQRGEATDGVWELADVIRIQDEAAEGAEAEDELGVTGEERLRGGRVERRVVEGWRG